MMKGEGKLDENTYRKIYPTGASAPKFYGLPKIHKENVPLRPIVSKYRLCHLWGSQRAVKDCEAFGW